MSAAASINPPLAHSIIFHLRSSHCAACWIELHEFALDKIIWETYSLVLNIKTTAHSLKMRISLSTNAHARPLISLVALITLIFSFEMLSAFYSHTHGSGSRQQTLCMLSQSAADWMCFWVMWYTCTSIMSLVTSIKGKDLIVIKVILN